jgi:hypothetical protein
MAVPCHALDSHHGNVAPEAAEAFNQCYIRACTCCANCCRKPPWSRTDNKHIGFMNYINFADWLDNLAPGFRHVLNLSKNYRFNRVSTEYIYNEDLASKKILEWPLKMGKNEPRRTFTNRDRRRCRKFEHPSREISEEPDWLADGVGFEPTSDSLVVRCRSFHRQPVRI